MVTRIQDPIILCYLIGFIVLLSPIFGFIAPKGLAPAIIFGGVAGIIILRIKKQYELENMHINNRAKNRRLEQEQKDKKLLLKNTK